jgi:hypothetical protein
VQQPVQQETELVVAPWTDGYGYTQAEYYNNVFNITSRFGSQWTFQDDSALAELGPNTLFQSTLSAVGNSYLQPQIESAQNAFVEYHDSAMEMGFTDVTLVGLQEGATDAEINSKAASDAAAAFDSALTSPVLAPQGGQKPVQQQPVPQKPVPQKPVPQQGGDMTGPSASDLIYCASLSDGINNSISQDTLPGAFDLLMKSCPDAITVDKSTDVQVWNALKAPTGYELFARSIDVPGVDQYIINSSGVKVSTYRELAMLGGLDSSDVDTGAEATVPANAKTIFKNAVNQIFYQNSKMGGSKLSLNYHTAAVTVSGPEITIIAAPSDVVDVGASASRRQNQPIAKPKDVKDVEELIRAEVIANLAGTKLIIRASALTNSLSVESRGSKCSQLKGKELDSINEFRKTVTEVIKQFNNSHQACENEITAAGAAAAAADKARSNLETALKASKTANATYNEASRKVNACYDKEYDREGFLSCVADILHNVQISKPHGGRLGDIGDIVCDASDGSELDNAVKAELVALSAIEKTHADGAAALSIQSAVLGGGGGKRGGCNWQKKRDGHQLAEQPIRAAQPMRIAAGYGQPCSATYTSEVCYVCPMSQSKLCLTTGGNPCMIPWDQVVLDGRGNPMWDSATGLVDLDPAEYRAMQVAYNAQK